MSCYIFYNSRAGGGIAAEKAKEYADKIGQSDALYDVTKINYSEIITDERDIIIFGGDGTLNRFVNATAGLKLQNRVFIYPLGTGNDFMNDLGIKPSDEAVEVTKYIKRLPICEIQGIRNYFINGVGFGIDGYCCQEGDRQKALGKKKVNYTAIAIKGMFGKFKPRDAKITVDGKEYDFKKVWLAPCMFGRYYGGGMIPTPDQSRENEEGTISVMVFHSLGKLGALMLFPSIFKGQHVKKENKVSVLTGKEIIVEFAEPCAAQIDGETVLNVRRARYLGAQELVALESRAR
jgi:diacylglycerol kinase family enzyme